MKVIVSKKDEFEFIFLNNDNKLFEDTNLFFYNKNQIEFENVTDYILNNFDVFYGDLYNIINIDLKEIRTMLIDNVIFHSKENEYRDKVSNLYKYNIDVNNKILYLSNRNILNPLMYKYKVNYKIFIRICGFILINKYDWEFIEQTCNL
jgi:hypothetical protein